MDQEAFKKLIESGRESISLEFKESQSWSALKAKVIRCILAMTNTRGGGNLIIGINNNADLLGVENYHLSTYNEEQIKDAVSVYSDPYVDFDMDIVDFEDKKFIVFTIREFSDVPVICKRSGDELEKGLIYIRTRNRRPESVKISDVIHMRELIELAIDKNNEQLRSRGWTYPVVTNSEEQFRNQISDLDI